VAAPQVVVPDWFSSSPANIRRTRSARRCGLRVVGPDDPLRLGERAPDSAGQAWERQRDGEPDQEPAADDEGEEALVPTFS
jgi:hypothetical protein